MDRLIPRSQVPEELTWNLADIFSSQEEWEAELRAVTGSIDSVTSYRGRLHEGPQVFLSCLEELEALMGRLIRVASYAGLKLETEATCQSNQAAAARVSALRARVEGDTAFVRSEALALPDGTLESYLKDPDLESFRPMIERMLEEKPHALSPETEAVLASLSEVLEAPSNVYRRSKAADMSFDPVEDSDGRERPMSFPAYEGRYERAADPVLRRNAFRSFTEGLRGYRNTYGTTWATEVRKNVVMARLRGFPSAIHMMLSRHQIPGEVYHSIHDVILKELAPHMRRYARLRKRVVGLEELLYCDLEAPLDPEYQPGTTYQEAAEIILGGLEVLGEEYVEIMRSALKDRWIDRAENAGKTTGAFCNSVYGVHPYIMVTWTDSMRDALVLAHELGHAGHGVLSQRYQRLVNCRPSMFFIEAPSTTNEILVGSHILRQSEDARFRRWVIEQLLMTYHHNFVRHLIEGELQRRVYALAEKEQPVNAGLLSRIQGEILEEFWGDELQVDEGARLTWMRQPHYYRGLYPYSYAAGLTVGTEVGRSVVEEGRPAAERWLEVLKAGGTKKPLELAQMAGVDMSRPDSIKRAVEYVGSLVDEMEKSY